MFRGGRSPGPSVHFAPLPNFRLNRRPEFVIRGPSYRRVITPGASAEEIIAFLGTRIEMRVSARGKSTMEASRLGPRLQTTGHGYRTGIIGSVRGMSSCGLLWIFGPVISSWGEGER
jgi:hypothetical protein